MSVTQEARSRPDSVDVFALQSSEIDDHWFWIRRFLALVESPPWKPEHVRADLKAAQAQAWTLVNEQFAPQGVIVTRIENYHDVRTGLLWICAGSGIERGRVLLEAIESWFRSMGCQRIEISGRKGWERVLPDYELSAVVLVKEL